MPRIRYSPWAPLLLCLMIRLSPRGSVLSFLAAAILHESGHFLALRFMGGHWDGLDIGPGGIRISCSGLENVGEIVTAAAGPLVSFFLIFLYPLFPWIGFWSILQLCFNLLPVYPLDGGRILRAVLEWGMDTYTAQKLSRVIGGGTILILSVFLLLHRELGVLRFPMAGFFLLVMIILAGNEKQSCKITPHRIQ